MNCFEARSDFVAFWQKTLAHERQGQLLMHLRGCATCDRSFRTFALTAPVLYSATEPDPNPQAARQIGLNVNGSNLSSSASNTELRSNAWTLNRFLPAFVMAAAAAIALYFAVPPHMTFEDAIATDNSNTEVASYPLTDSFFGQELMIQDTTAPDQSDE